MLKTDSHADSASHTPKDLGLRVEGSVRKKVPGSPQRDAGLPDDNLLRGRGLGFFN
jgi:hypothetical protein